jgi:hypothetical protein
MIGAIEQSVQDAPVLEEQRYIYQPIDENGRNIGAPQVIKYHTEEELRNKLVEQNTLLLRKLRQKTKNERLGIVENEEIGTEVTRYVGPVEFSPRTLSNEEYAEIAHDLTNPETAIEAQKRLFEASLGASADKVGETLRSLQEDVMATRAVAEANAFIAETPEFYKCEENANTLAAYLSRYNLAPILANFKYAFNKLNELDPSPFVTRPSDIPTPVTVASEPVVREPVLTVHEEPRSTEFPSIGLGSGLTRETSGDVQPVVTVGEDIFYDVSRDGKLVRLTGLAAVNAMPGDEYGRRIRNERNFQKKVDSLYVAEAAKKRQANQGSI